MQDFPTQVCVHLHEKPAAPERQRLPLFVLVSRKNRVLVIEGLPDYEELRALIDQIVKLPGESSVPSR